MSSEESLKNIFVIGPLKEPESETRKRSDSVKRHIIDKAAEKIGYSTLRSDEISEPGIITHQIVERLMNDYLVIADLTDQNPNVFYELAIRHMVSKPVILLLQKGQKIPFDISAQRVIYFDIIDLDNVDECKNELIDQIKAVNKEEFVVDSPIESKILIKKEQSNKSNYEIAEMNVILRNIHNLITQISSKFDNISDVKTEDKTKDEEILNFKIKLQDYMTELAREQRTNAMNMSKIRWLEEKLLKFEPQLDE